MGDLGLLQRSQRVGEMADEVMKVGVIGYRSWIASALIDVLEDQGYLVDRMPKDPSLDMRGYKCVFLFAGRSRPSVLEIADEKLLVERIAGKSVDSCPRRLVYISSARAMDGGTIAGLTDPYLLLKYDCELMLRTRYTGSELRIVRLPAVFGAGQPRASTMLVPTIARDGHSAALKEPKKKAVFGHVDDVVVFLSEFCNEKIDTYKTIDAHEIPGSFYASARNIKDLAETLMFYWGL